jgi:hypothetical protein
MGRSGTETAISGSSRYNVPFRIKPDFGKPPENVSSPPSVIPGKQCCDVFQYDDGQSPLPGMNVASKSDNVVE